MLVSLHRHARLSPTTHHPIFPIFSPLFSAPSVRKSTCSRCFGPDIIKKSRRLASLKSSQLRPASPLSLFSCASGRSDSRRPTARLAAESSVPVDPCVHLLSLSTNFQVVSRISLVSSIPRSNKRNGDRLVPAPQACFSCFLEPSRRDSVFPILPLFELTRRLTIYVTTHLSVLSFLAYQVELYIGR
jgi:hypothetical protein